MKWTATVEEDKDGNAILVFPEGCLPEDWVEGTEIRWVDQKDGSWLLEKVMPKKYVLVETISQYRMRYVIEVPENHMDGEFPCPAIQWAEDTVTCEEMKEFSQKWLGETITSSREVEREEILRLCNEDNDYCDGKYGEPWSDDKKMEVFVTPVGYKPDY